VWTLSRETESPRVSKTGLTSQTQTSHPPLLLLPTPSSPTHHHPSIVDARPSRPTRTPLQHQSSPCALHPWQVKVKVARNLNRNQDFTNYLSDFQGQVGFGSVILAVLRLVQRAIEEWYMCASRSGIPPRGTQVTKPPINENEEVMCDAS
jgi:hypothetical protein